MYEAPYYNMLFGSYTMASLPAAAPEMAGRFAYVTDRVPGAGFMVCDAVNWVNDPTRKIETFNGVTNAGGDYSVVFPVAYTAVPHINPVTYPPADADTRVRVTAISTTGFTVRTEKNIGLTVLSLTVLGFGTAPVASVPVRVLVIES